MDDRRAWQRLLAPIWRRIRLLISRGVVRLVDDSLKLQGVQVTLQGGEAAFAERFQNYGHTSRPHPGAEAIVLAVGGARSHLVALSVDDRRYRLVELEEGESALYDDQGQKVHLTRGGIQVLSTGTVAIGTEDEELLALVSELMDLLAKTTTATSLGPQPLKAAPEIADLKQRLDSIKGAF